MNHQTPHLSFEKIADLAIDGVANTLSNEHLAACTQCLREKSSLERLVNTMRTDRLEDAPRYAVMSILRAFDEREMTATEVKPSVIERLTAIIRFDSLSLEPARGFRSATSSAGRKMLLSAGDLTFDLRLKQVDGKVELSGQVLGDAESGVLRLENQSESYSAEVGPDGDFLFDAVPEGVYRFLFNGNGIEVEFAALEVS